MIVSEKQLQLGIINGPNLNLLGKREPDLYGEVSFESYLDSLRKEFREVTLHYFQTNHEGAIIDQIQRWNDSMDGIILNAAAYTHTSIAIADVLAALPVPVVEVHLTDIRQREPFRMHSYLTPHCEMTIMGEGLKGYAMAIRFLLRRNV